MLEAFRSLHTLRWTNPPTYHPLPDNVTRTFIKTSSRPNDKLELLVSDNTTLPSQTRPPPILFLHGGFGNASVWLPFISQLSATTPCYALSYRNHGASYSVSYLRMVYGTGIADLCSDIVAAIDHVTTATGQSPILVAHSSGGGLVQYLLANGLAKIPALMLLDTVPYFGMAGVYVNWAKADPWFAVRLLLHLWHPISPLSSVSLVRGVFFGSGSDKQKSLSDSEVNEFARWMPKYESLLWPMGQMGSFFSWLFGGPTWLRPQDVLKSIKRQDSRLRTDRVCVISGSHDVLMDPQMCRRTADGYRVALTTMKEYEETDSISGIKLESVRHVQGATIESKDGVRLVLVHGAGHHAQNDVQWETAAEALKHFIEQV